MRTTKLEDKLWKGLGLRVIYFVFFLIGILHFINQKMFLFYFFALVGLLLTVMQIFSCGYELGWEYKRIYEDDAEECCEEDSD